MTDWFAQAPAFFATLALLIVPGLPAALLTRVHGILRLGVAIALSVAVIVAASIVAPFVGMRWSLLPVMLVMILVTCAATLLRVLDRKRGPIEIARTSPWAWASVGVAFILWTVLITIAIVDPSHPSQLYDGIFHINAVEFIAQNGDASPFHMTMAYPGRETVFYPTAWHALVSLVLPAAGSAVAATNVVTVAATALIWPVALSSLTIVLFPAHRNANVWTPLVAFGFSVFPFGFLTWGVLYPNLLGNLLLPLLICFVLLACRPGLSAASRSLWTLVALATAAGTAMGHPSALLAGVVLLVPFGLWHAWRGWKVQHRAGRRIALAGAVLLGVAALLTVWIVANVTTHEWLPSLTFAQAIGELTFLSPSGRATGLLLGPLAVVGIWRVIRDGRWWIAAAHAVAAFFFMVAAWLTILPVRSFFVGVWYDDTTRVAALLTIFGLPLAGLGASVTSSWLISVLKARKRLLFATVTVLLIAAAATHLLAVRDDLRYSRDVAFRFDELSQALTPDEVALFEKADEIIEGDSVTIADPLTGAGLFLAYTGREVVFPHVGGSYGGDAALLKAEFADGGEEVCAAAERLGVDYAFDFGDRVLFEDYRAPFDGLHDLARAPDLTEVARVGDAALYRLTGCSP